jgi:hypothetical protein
MHEVVNGANGSVTWCSGLDCPRCKAMRETQNRALAEPLTVQQHHCPGCRCQPAIRLGGGTMPLWGYQYVGIGA